MRKAWDIMLDEIYDEEALVEICKKTKGAKYEADDKNIRFTGTQERMNEVCRATKKCAKIWGVILLWTIGAG